MEDIVRHIEQPTHRERISTYTIKFFVRLLGLELLLVGSVAAQVIYVPVSHEVYPFLKRMQSRHLLLNYRDAMKPLSRRVIADHLLALQQLTDKMTDVERDEFEFLKGDFNYEFLSLQGDSTPSEIRWHVYSLPVTDGIMNLDIDYRLQREWIDGSLNTLRTQGLKLSGYAFRDVGFYFNYVDNREQGTETYANTLKANSPAPGVIITRGYGDVFEYDNTDVQLTIKVGPFDFSVEKMNNIWGFGRHGNIIFSDKPPSFPLIKMRVPISKDIDFVYFHGQLKSGLIDSAASYHTYSSSLYDFYRPVYRQKWIAAHMLEFSLFRGVNFSIGESEVYSDRGPDWIYLIPIMFFKGGEHFTSDEDNAQMFGNLDLTVIRNLNMYFSLFIDELNTDQLFDPYYSRRQIAVQLGFQTYDLLLQNLELVGEYARGNPWVYNHKYTAANFTTAGYDLGHWVGQNGDDLYFDISYAPKRGLKFGAYSEVFRKGDKKDVSFQYAPDNGHVDFLYGPLYHEERSYGMYGKYEPLRDLFLDIRAGYRKTLIQGNSDPTLNKDEKRFEITAGASVGVW